jgi:hypothetical protein
MKKREAMPAGFPDMKTGSRQKPTACFLLKAFHEQSETEAALNHHSAAVATVMIPWRRADRPRHDVDRPPWRWTVGAGGRAIPAGSRNDPVSPNRRAAALMADDISLGVDRGSAGTIAADVDVAAVAASSVVTGVGSGGDTEES